MVKSCAKQLLMTIIQQSNVHNLPPKILKHTWYKCFFPYLQKVMKSPSYAKYLHLVDMEEE